MPKTSYLWALALLASCSGEPSKAITIASTFPLSSPAASAPLAAEKAKEIFHSFVQSLTDTDLNGGNCVNHSTRFAERLVQAGLPSADIRIVLIVREPNRGMPNPIKPAPDYVRGAPVSFWIWHAVVMVNGVVFDPKYKPLTAPVADYRNTMWPQSEATAKFWIFSMPPHQLNQIAGSDYPGGPPRMLRFHPITFQELIQTPSHISLRK